jgi:hypothetical protein
MSRQAALISATAGHRKPVVARHGGDLRSAPPRHPQLVADERARDQSWMPALGQLWQRDSLAGDPLQRGADGLHRRRRIREAFGVFP